jgi:hypothetical protein
LSDHLYNLIFGLAVAFVVPAICFLLGMFWSKLIGGWGDTKFRKWWTTFCLLMPFIFFGIVVRRMAEDNFVGLRAVWSSEPIQLITVTAFAILLSTTFIFAVLRLWRMSRS